MLMPKKTKYRKVQRGSRRGLSKGARTVDFGEYGLQVLEPAWLTAQQIEAMRVSITRRLKKGGTVFVRAFPDKPVTKKPAETRMGKGKGAPELWVAVCKRGRVICEVGGLTELEAKEALKQAAYKLPIRTKFVTRAEATHEE
ncbi:MAG: 50S ribosomal protein L16 [Candidatus Babeliales bacterium]